MKIVRICKLSPAILLNIQSILVWVGKIYKACGWQKLKELDENSICI